MKVWDSEALGLIADDAVQCFGGYGFSAEYPPEKIYRDNRINRLFEGTNEINRMIIAGQIFKKVGNATLPMTRDLANLPAKEAFGGPLAFQKHALELAKRQMGFAVATALEALGQKLIETQEAAARVADMAMDIYAIESAVVRAERMVEDGHRWASFAQDAATVAVNEALDRVAAHARLLVAEVLDGEPLVVAITSLRTAESYVPVASSRLRDRLAATLIEREGYPIQSW